MSKSAKSPQTPCCYRWTRYLSMKALPLKSEINLKKYEHPHQVEDLNPTGQIIPPQEI